MDGGRIIDGHTHLFPPEVREHREAYLSRDAWFGELYAAPNITFATPEEMIASMDEAGIATSVICGWPWRDGGLCREHNDFLADLCRQYPERLEWLAIVNPLDADAAAEVERAVSLGARGIGELNADAQGFAWDEPAALRETMRACVELGVPMLAHCSEPVGHAYPGKGTATPDRLLTFLAANPDLNVVGAHWGGGLPFYEMMPEVAALTRNVVYDSAASTYLFRWDVFPVVERLVGADRIVFGTDFPLLKQKPFLRRTRESGMSAAGMDQILGGTAARVFGLGDERRNT